MISSVERSKEPTKTLLHLVRTTRSQKAEGPQQEHPLDIQEPEAIYKQTTVNKASSETIVKVGNVDLHFSLQTLQKIQIRL